MKTARSRLPTVLNDFWRTLLFLGVISAAQAPISCALAAEENMQSGHQHSHSHDTENKIPDRFIATTEKPFAELMNDAMLIMDSGMTKAPMNGNPEHDFVTMMVPHHQGAVDMAKALLLYSKDPELVNLAQGIIAEQQNEIKLMQLWLRRHGYPPMPSGDGN